MPFPFRTVSFSRRRVGRVLRSSLDHVEKKLHSSVRHRSVGGFFTFTRTVLIIARERDTERKSLEQKK